jgi:hypothetical protein
MDGTSIVIQVKGSGDTSTITQTAQSITIKCKTFELDAETITCKSQKASLYQSSDTLTLKSTRDLQLGSSANLAAQASRDVTVHGTNVKLQAKQEFLGAGMDARYQAADGRATTTAGVAVQLSSKAQLKGEAPFIQLSASEILKAEAGAIASFKGALTTIAGELIKIG